MKNLSKRDKEILEDLKNLYINLEAACFYVQSIHDALDASNIENKPPQKLKRRKT
jgi:hypothetical protein